MTLRKKRYHFRISVFAKGCLLGGTWENDVLVWGHTPEQGFRNALQYIAKTGFAYEVTITHCRANGEDFDYE